ncbi:GumC family protein [Mangrovicella endophytica]|uniref:GumC family protein n=1 Tax=Mangrovicella endophytica TaxID=2066697 RepID=UPI001AECED07|nr:GumC family protein [Mangrovicella endophytica]
MHSARTDRGRPGGGSLFDPVQLFVSVWNAKALIIACMVLGGIFGGLYAFSSPKTYVATTQILVDPRDIKVVQNEVTPNGLPSEATLALIESQIAVIYSNNVLSRAVAEAKLVEDPEFNAALRPSAFSLGRLFGGAISEEDAKASAQTQELKTLATLREHMTASRETKSFVINLSISSEVPEKAAQLAQLIAGIFIDEMGRVQSDVARRASSSLTSRLTELRERVVDAEREVEAYKAKNALIGVGGRLVDDQYIIKINDQLANARADITTLKVRSDSMAKARVEDVVKGTLPEELKSDTLTRLRASYSDLAQQAAVVATKLGPRHPQRIASEEALASVRGAIQNELARIVSAARTELDRAQTTERDLTAQLNELKDKQVTTSEAFVKLRELEREVDASRAVYEAFLLRARETGEQESLNTANVRVISEATTPLDPSSVSRKTVIIAGTIIGFVAGLSLAILFALVGMIRRGLKDEPVGSFDDGEPVVHATPATVVTYPVEPAYGPAAATPAAAAAFSDPMPAAASLSPSAAKSGVEETFDTVDTGDRLRDDVPETDAAAAFGRRSAEAASMAGGWSADESAALREQIRAIAARQAAEPRELSPTEEAEVMVLQREIETVKEAIAAIRRRRVGEAAH